MEDSILAYVKIYQPCALDDIKKYFRNTIGDFKVHEIVWQLVEEGKIQFNIEWLLELK